MDLQKGLFLEIVDTSLVTAEVFSKSAIGWVQFFLVILPLELQLIIIALFRLRNAV